MSFDKKRFHIDTIMLFTVLIIVMTGCSSPLDEQRDEFNLRVYPSFLEMNNGEETFISIWVDQADGLISARFTLSYDPEVIEVVRILTSGLSYLFSEAEADVFELEKVIDNENGTLIFGLGAQKKGFTGAEGSGALAEIVIKAKTTGTSEIKFIDNRPDDVMTNAYSETSEAGWVEHPVVTFNGIIQVTEQ
ncbi:cohesin domain-containing protein [Candidatus Latescibacterota bacterium]